MATIASPFSKVRGIPVHARVVFTISNASVNFHRCHARRGALFLIGFGQPRRIPATADSLADRLESQMKSGRLPKHRSLAALAVMLLVGWVGCADVQGPPMAMAQSADKAALLAELMKLEAASWQYIKNTNVSALKKYLAEDALLISGNGMHFTKAEFIKGMPDVRLDSFTIQPNADIKVWTPEVATVLYRVTYVSAIKNAKASTMNVLASSTYVRRNGYWLSVLYQETPVQ
jgi:hypothetical protein